MIKVQQNAHRALKIEGGKNTMRKFLATLLALVMTLALMVPASWGENKETYQLPDSLEGKTVILHTNDVHGAIDKYAKVAADVYKRQAKGINVGLVRPITVWPFPYDAVREAACQDSVKAVLDVELNEGQMLEDVKLAINGAKPIDFTGHCGSQMPTTDEIVEKILSMKEGK